MKNRHAWQQLEPCAAVLESKAFGEYEADYGAAAAAPGGAQALGRGETVRHSVKGAEAPGVGGDSIGDAGAVSGGAAEAGPAEVVRQRVTRWVEGTLMPAMSRQARLPALFLPRIYLGWN